MRSSIYFVAVYSVIFRFRSEDAGGIYILNILIRVLLGNSNLTRIPYSLVCVFSTCKGFRMYVAIPPLVPSDRLDSINRNPSKSGGAAPSAIHVSYRHSTSISSCSSISNNFI